MTTVLKLGGSVITDKDREGTVATATLEAIADALAAAEHDRLVVIIGGGSFGHPAAARHGMSVTTGTHDPVAIAEVHAAMLDLVDRVVDTLIDAGVSAVPFHPLSMARREPAGLSIELAALDLALDEGLVPVLHGDGVVTATEGVTVLSGDALVVECARHLDASRVGLCTTVAGVLDESGEVIDRIDRFEPVADVVGASEATDVSGGMAGKVSQLLTLESEAAIFDLAGLAPFLAGEQPGTTIGSS